LLAKLEQTEREGELSAIASAKQTLLAKLTRYFGEQKSLIEWRPILQALKAYKALVYLQYLNARHTDIYYMGSYSDIGSYDFNCYELPESVTHSQKAIHVRWNNNSQYRHVENLPGLSAKEKEHLKAQREKQSDEPINFAWHLNRFYRLIHRVVWNLNDLKQNNKNRRKQRKIKLQIKKALEEIVAHYPDTLRQLILEPLLYHHAYPHSNSLKKTNRLLLLQRLQPEEANTLLHRLVSVPGVRHSFLRDGVTADVITEMLKVTDDYKIRVDLNNERRFCHTILERAKDLQPVDEGDGDHIETEIKQPIQRRLATLEPDNKINLQIKNLTFYFKHWRLANASRTVRFFKSKKTNRQRETQLDLLQTLLNKETMSDAVKVGALIKISTDIGRERNVFVSEMKKQVDRIIDNYLQENATENLSKGKLKESCITAYRDNSRESIEKIAINGAH
jgi:hypothetical protein